MNVCWEPPFCKLHNTTYPRETNDIASINPLTDWSCDNRTVAITCANAAAVVYENA
uniref:Uncharacterized protein n=1 Tax=mine drainage metagenome TaxID=410659 RepID=E6QJM5_9ZZZZ